ncbi:tyrosine-protein phosphatase [Dinghuibacter silviterrae]|uniref:Protein-tyrosine phosphatase n=1 Tax=Dinghuibacter silviterrae TaxID=1539049 RepID=A0A4R8DTT4_9BACT|nr:tyrosine-protein phosphatase [Dinghuibacter silviterrae]TDX00827.1 protein-tyrosine phosphatase [Dinghuibacter silviterrae]
MQKIFLLYALLALVQPVHAQVADSTRRHIALQGAVNVRDLGGYPGADGRLVKWGSLYRAADISKLTDGDLRTLDSLHIRCDVDLRGVAESAQAPDKINPGTDYLLCPAGSDSTNKWMRQLVGLQSGGDSMMIAFYANTTYLTARYKPFFDKLLTLPDTSALLFHCTAGKDRTGIGAALVLYALGVPYTVIRADYEATNVYRKDANERMIQSMVKGLHINEQVARDMLSAKGMYLDATFAALRSQYGSIDAYLHDQLGLDDSALSQLRNRFLQ